jgi:hypothetical protein
MTDDERQIIRKLDREAALQHLSQFTDEELRKAVEHVHDVRGAEKLRKSAWARPLVGQ